MSALLSLLLLCLPFSPGFAARAAKKAAPRPHAAPQAPSADDRRLDELQKEITAVMDDISPKLRRVEAFKEAYYEKQDVYALSAEREQVLGGIRPNIEKLVVLEDEFNRTRQAQDTLKLVSTLGRVMSGTGLTMDAGTDLTRHQSLMEFGRDVRAFRERAMVTLSTEDTAFKAAKQAQDAQKLWLMITVVLLVLAGAAGTLLWRRMRSMKTAQLLSAKSTKAGVPGAPALPGPADAPIGPGSVLGNNYRIEKELGRGGMGFVYEAVDLTLHRKVAIKRMRQEISASGKELDMFLAEARMVAALKHPNLVEIYSIVREGSQVLLVFEFVSGQVLHAFLDEGRRISLRSTKGVLRQICGALDYAHSRKVIHRDLKPANIMITPEGVAKVMDFGIAHQAKMTVARMTRTEAWGTPPYMAPEQELGTVSRESDLFALGVIFYEMMTGKMPYGGPNFLAQKQEMVFVPPSKAVPGIPAGVDEVVRRALQAEVSKRFHSAAEFLAALETIPENGQA